MMTDEGDDYDGGSNIDDDICLGRLGQAGLLSALSLPSLLPGRIIRGSLSAGQHSAVMIMVAMIRIIM